MSMNTSVSYSSTESIIISLDTLLRMDDIPTLDIWWSKYYIHPTAIYHKSRPKKMQTKAESRSYGKLQKAHPTSEWEREGIRIMINYEISIMWSQTQSLLNVERICTFFKTTRQWSRWLSKNEVQLWDACLEYTESRWIGTSWSKSHMLTAKAKSQTYWVKEVLRVMNSATFLVYSTSWISLRSLALIYVQFENSKVISKRIQERKSA